MVELKLIFTHPTLSHSTFTLVQFKRGDLWTLFGSKGVQIGTLDKVNGKWEQIGGRQTHDEIIEAAGKLIDESNGD